MKRLQQIQPKSADDACENTCVLFCSAKITEVYLYIYPLLIAVYVNLILFSSLFTSLNNVPLIIWKETEIIKHNFRNRTRCPQHIVCFELIAPCLRTSKARCIVLYVYHHYTEWRKKKPSVKLEMSERIMSRSNDSDLLSRLIRIIGSCSFMHKE